MNGQGQRGFTLLELLVVLVIAVMATTLVAPGFRQVTERMALRGDSQKVAALLRFARSESIGQGTTVSVELWAERHALILHSPRHSAVYPLEISVAISLSAQQPQLPEQSRILFYPDGSSSGGGVHLRSQSGHYQIAVDWLTGGVSVEG